MTLRRILMVVAVLAATLVPVVPAHADPSGGGGGNGKGDYYAWVASRVKYKGHAVSNNPKPVAVDPPHCWYQPEYTHPEMLEWAQRIYFAWHHQGREDQVGAHDWYEKTLAEINKHAGEPGVIFWFLTDDGTDAGWDCYLSTDPFWIYVGPGAPSVPGDKIIDPQDLALLARAHLSLPQPKVELLPGRKNGVYTSYVGLRTWVKAPWPIGVKDVTAYVEGYPALSATITARPLRMKITADNGTAHVGADCPPYRKGGDGCWVVFNRASLGGRYRITVTQVWAIGSDVPGANLQPNPAEMSTTQTVVVDEIQSAVTR
ncbi:hypothetical protein [Microbispora sp. NPDC049125]|uniref:hypothetical protein n=1 Tax=Microbispora sp. NPDC049125 TaxID=3154929 RepID=UPI003465DB8C